MSRCRMQEMMNNRIEENRVIDARAPIVNRIVRVTYESDVIGSGVFFEGVVDDKAKIANVVAAGIARQTAADGLPRKAGMWRSAVVEP